jgi:hypothetical protein
VVRVLVNYDVIAIPIPVAAIRDIQWRNAEVITIEPETVRTASGQPPFVTAADAFWEVPVFPGTIEVETGVIASIVVPDPFVVVVDVWSFRMSGSVCEGWAPSVAGLIPAAWPSTIHFTPAMSAGRCRTMRWHVSPADITMPTVPASGAAMLRKYRQTQ